MTGPLSEKWLKHLENDTTLSKNVFCANCSICSWMALTVHGNNSTTGLKPNLYFYTQVYTWHARQRTEASRDAALATQHIVVPPHTSNIINQQQVAVHPTTSTINQQQVAALAHNIYAQQQVVAVSRDDGNVQAHTLVRNTYLLRPPVQLLFIHPYLLVLPQVLHISSRRLALASKYSGKECVYMCSYHKIICVQFSQIVVKTF